MSGRTRTAILDHPRTRAEDGRTRIECRFEHETIWLHAGS